MQIHNNTNTHTITRKYTIMCQLCKYADTCVAPHRGPAGPVNGQGDCTVRLPVMTTPWVLNGKGPHEKTSLEMVCHFQAAKKTVKLPGNKMQTHTLDGQKCIFHFLGVCLVCQVCLGISCFLKCTFLNPNFLSVYLIRYTDNLKLPDYLDAYKFRSSPRSKKR